MKRLIEWFKRSGENDTGFIMSVVELRPGHLGFRDPRWQVKPIIAWYDCWIGVFVDRKERKVYVFPLPCIGLCIYWG